MVDKKDIETKELQITPDGTERTRDYRCYTPQADIYEVDENIIVVLDFPGINENAIDVTLEKNILTVKGLAQVEVFDNYSLVFTEYEPGDYERSFRITDAIDREKIEANFNNGVLRLVLPRAEQAKTKKITVKVG